VTKPQREAQRLAYQALQEALDRRDNGGRSSALAEAARSDERDGARLPVAASNSSR
jgi:hypothetical protein